VKLRMLVAVVALLLLPAPAQAGSEEVSPETFKPVKGTVVSEGDPVEALANDDEDRLSIETTSGTAAFQVAFIDISQIDDTIGLRIVAGVDPTACDYVPRLWHWRKQRFVAIDEAREVEEGPDEEFFAEATGFAKYVRNGKAKAKITCVGNGTFSLLVNQLRLVP
jgi:hypothetical protein